MMRASTVHAKSAFRGVAAKPSRQVLNSPGEGSQRQVAEGVFD
jgi:hypothetical protein